jgi:cysteine-rich repeat protein
MAADEKTRKISRLYIWMKAGPRRGARVEKKVRPRTQRIAAEADERTAMKTPPTRPTLLPTPSGLHGRPPEPPMHPTTYRAPRQPLSILHALALSLATTGCFNPLVTLETDDTDSEGATTDAATTDADSTDAISEPDSGSGDGLTPVCGNGVVEDDEVCDDGVNDGSYGSCNADCTAPGPFCGDGAVNGEEPCDDGDDVDGNGCNVDCVVSGSVLWTVTYDGPDHGSDLGRGVVVDPNDHVVVTGSVNVDGASSAWVRRYTPEGAADWTSFFPSKEGSSFAGPVVALPDGNLVFGGGFDTADAEISPDAWIQRIGEQGDQVWVRTHTSPQGWWDQVSDVDVDADGYIYALFTIGDQGFVRKYTQDGAELWSVFLDDTIHPSELATDSTGGTVIVGNDRSGPDHAPYMAKFNSEGGSEWAQVLEEYDDAYFTTVDVDAAGNIIAGLIYINADPRLLFFDPEGTPTGISIFPFAEEPVGWIESVLLIDGGESVAGGLKGSDGHLWLTKYASNGDELWTYTYNGEEWGYGFDVIYSLDEDSNGNIIAAGTIQDSEVTQQDIWLVKLAP